MRNSREATCGQGPERRRTLVPPLPFLVALVPAMVLWSFPALGREVAVRQPRVAGTFYPASPSELSNAVEAFLKSSPQEHVDGPIRALIVPHAGYVYSGQVAARGYNLLSQQYRRVIIVASNHYGGGPPFKFSVSGASHYETPLGRVRVSEIAGELLKNDLFSYVPEVHSTHIIEVQLPFLQKILREFEIVPIVTGRASDNELAAVAELISRHLDQETLLIVSSDLSHYHPYDKAVELDRRCIDAVEAQDLGKAAGCEACGLPSIMILLQIAREKGWRSRIIDYKNSGDTAGTKDRVVGYSSIVFWQEDLSGSDRRQLLKISRTVLDSRIGQGIMPEINEERDFSQRLLKKQGCFVTLEIDHSLRGCIGHIIPQEPLYRCVIQNTVSAALHDGRFKPVTKEELDRIKIEISVLSVPTPLERKDPQQLLNSLVPLTHGVILRNGPRQSTFLPQVWEQFQKKEDFLSRLCLKGGLVSDCWKNSETTVLTYEASVFGE